MCPACGLDLSGESFVLDGEAACPGCGQALWVFGEQPPSLAPLVRHEQETLDTLHDERLGEHVIAKLGRPPRVVFDVGRVRFATSAGVGRLVTLKARLDPAQVRLVLRKVPDQLKKTLSTLGLDAAFEMLD
jgi:anti-anti-sigma regulatory factor